MATFNDKKAKYQGHTLLSGDLAKAERERISKRKEAAEKNANGRPTFAYFAAHDEEFKAACEAAGIPATARQASKWHRHRGLAWANRKTGNEVAA